MATVCYLSLPTLLLVITMHMLSSSLTEGVCVQRGIEYQNNTIWRPSPCQICSCHGKMVSCEDVRCHDPGCNFNKGERLTIQSGDCCPNCLPAGLPCYHGNETYLHLMSWKPSACQTCTCEAGNARCINDTCTAISCPVGQLLQHLSNQCCPLCIPAGRRCSYHGNEYQDGESWEPLLCARCRCEDGVVNCYTHICPTLHCKSGEVVSTRPGQCCPQCVAPPCEHQGKLYQRAERWVIDRCTACQCDSEGVRCERRSCEPSHNCAQGETKVWEEDRCCPLCVKQGRPCHVDGRAYHHSDIWKAATCRMCVCREGHITCRNLTCSSLTCSQLEVEATSPDQCCPRCVARQSCEHQSGVFKHGVTWKPAVCDICECHDGTASCYTQHCPDCPAGSDRQAIPGQCCGQCVPVQCPDHCARCQMTNENICNKCKNSTWHHLEGGNCVTECSPGHYLHPNQTCIPCVGNCATCTGPTRFHCTTCEHQRFWQQGECVATCWPAHVLHKGICQACPLNCLRCNTTETCSECKADFQLQAQQCRPRCRKGGYWNRNKLRCAANKHRPVFSSACVILAIAGDRTALTRDMLNVTDKDTGIDELIIHIALTPSNGKLLLVTGGKDHQLQVGSSFSVQQLAEGRVGFRHDATAPLTGRVQLWAEDGYNTGILTDIPVYVTSRSPPVLHRNDLLVVEQGQKVALSSTHLDVDDPDNAGAVILTIIQGPQRGYITKTDVTGEVSNFTLSELRQSLLIYVHDNSSPGYDQLTLQITDGTYANLFLITLIITPMGTASPVVVATNPLYMDVGHLGVISSYHLRSVLSPDDNNNIVYTLTPPRENPRNGYLLMVVPMPSTGPTTGWRRHGDGKMAAKMVRFRQSDIDEGRMWYQHNGVADRTDAIHFKVCDRAQPPHCQEDQVLQVRVTQLQQDTGDQHTPAHRFPGQQARRGDQGPGFSPTLVFVPDENDLLGTTVFDGEVTPLEATDFGTYIPNTGPEEVVYLVTSALSAGEGTLEHVNFPGVPVHRFSQADLVSKRIVYHPPVGGIGMVDRELTISFVVEDMSSGHKLPEQTFTIHVLPVATRPPFILDSNPVVKVPQGSNVSIDQAVVRVTDEDTPLPELVVTVEKMPKSGKLLKIEGNKRTVLRAGDRFKYMDVLHGRILYSHDGLNTVQDGIYLTVSDTDHTVDIHVRLLVTAVARSSLLLDSDATLVITLPEGTSRQILRDHIAFQDSSDSNILFIMAVEPQSGQFTLDDTIKGREPITRGQRFTQADINQGRVWFQAEAEVGPREKISNVYFNVSKLHGNTVLVQQLTVTTTPVNNRPPVVSLGTNMEVEEGSRIPLTLDDIKVMDLDTLTGQLEVVVDEGPHFGVLEQVLRVSGSEKTQSVAVTNFTVKDIVEGHVHYVQSDHKNREPRRDSFIIHVTDGRNRSPQYTLHINIRPTNDEAPVLVAGSLVCRVGSGVDITNASLGVLDIDSLPFELIFTVEELPQQGDLRRRSFPQDNWVAARPIRQGTSFTYEDVLGGLLVYTHSGRQLQPARDVFSVRLTDGDFTTGGRISVQVVPADMEVPRVVVNRGLRIPPGSITVLTPLDLRATDLDSDDNQLVFTLTRGPTLGRWMLTLDSGSSRTLQVLRGTDPEEQPAARGPKVKVSPGSATLEEVTRKPTPLEYKTRHKFLSLLKLSHPGKVLRSGEGSPSRTRRSLPLSPLEHQRVEEAHDTVVAEFPGDHTRIQNAKILDYPLSLDDELGDVFRPDLSQGHHPDSGDTYGGGPLTEYNFDSGFMLVPDAENEVEVSATGLVKSFTQSDINKGSVKFVHSTGDPEGISRTQFSVTDPEGSVLLDQILIVTVIDDDTLPTVTTNRQLEVKEGAEARITTDFLSASDVDSAPGKLRFTVLDPPKHGYLASTADRGVAVREFLQVDLAASAILYIHTDHQGLSVDSFTFSVSDGPNQVTRTFYIRIVDVDDGLPTIINHGLRVQEGQSKVITEFDLDLSDPDTQESDLTVIIVRPPRHASIQVLQHDDKPSQATSFTLEDIYKGHVTYTHDGTETTDDDFLFTVSDGTNTMFLVQGLDGATAQPQVFAIAVLPVDDGHPVLVTNLGLRYLQYQDAKPTGVISKQELYAEDSDTPAHLLQYHITTQPAHGHIENSNSPTVAVSSFTQDEINHGKIQYILTGKKSSTHDQLVFDLMDSKPNILSDNVFHIQWSYIQFQQSYFNVTETAHRIYVPVTRFGTTKQYSVVSWRTVPDTATAWSSRPYPGQADFKATSGQIQFEGYPDTKSCEVEISDDQVFEGVEVFYLELSHPEFMLLGDPARATIAIHDLEDEPMVEFDHSLLLVNESSGFLLAPLTRSGDLSAASSVICATRPLSAIGSSDRGLESGSDYQTRPESDWSRIVFTPQSAHTTCDVRIIDDSLFEPSEQFELILSEPSTDVKLGVQTKVLVTITGPNDESVVFLSESVYFVDESVGELRVPVVRGGADLTAEVRVLCGAQPTDPISALPGEDFLPCLEELVFHPGQMSQFCVVTIIDDVGDVHLEGNETFEVYLMDPQGASLSEPQSSIVIINDTNTDVVRMQFDQPEYIVDEARGWLHVPVLRSGDVSYESSLICYTRQQGALVMMDYEERPLADVSRITFLPGVRVQNCSVRLVNDDVWEDEETFLLRLTDPLGHEHCGARVGDIAMTTITITDHLDMPRLEFESSTYTVSEPRTHEEVVMASVVVVRHGDKSETVEVRCGTRDGSAVSGIDYDARSDFLTFLPGVNKVTFEVDILHNPSAEWHETFGIMLGPQQPFNAVFGGTIVTRVTILDNQISASLMFPAPPVVVSLMDYDDVAMTTNTPSPGFPVICITACDPKHPMFSVTTNLCASSGINQSAVLFHWEVAMPTHAFEQLGTRSLFRRITDNLPFSQSNQMVLDSVFFRPHFRVRCTVQPIQNSGQKGAPVTSKGVTIGSDNGMCRLPHSKSLPAGLHGQSFLADLVYLEPTDKYHPNTVQITVRVPHQDGLLPLVSTRAIHNLRYLLTTPSYRSQHLCSNFVPSHEDLNFEITIPTQPGFLCETNQKPSSSGPGLDLAYQFDPVLRGKQAVDLYKHLDLRRCEWTFTAWYDMTELVQQCGGKVVSDFEIHDALKSHVTIQVPLYVSYVYAAAPSGWSALEHRTQLSLSILYDTMAWKAGLGTGPQPQEGLNGDLHIVKVSTNHHGNLVIDFKTQTSFRGLFISSHPSHPDWSSRVVAPRSLPLTFTLDLVWGQETFDSPQQTWRATSNLSLRDYSGEYSIELLPCTVNPTMVYTHMHDVSTVCSPHPPHRFAVVLTFQQTLQPEPAVYALATNFQVTSHLGAFLTDPMKNNTGTEAGFDGVFSQGNLLYGRVMWNPSQDLQEAYSLRIEKVFICSGGDGYVPTYDPTGEVYGAGPQYGCMQPTHKLRHRFMILDRGDPEFAVQHLQGIPFGARFASDDPKYRALRKLPGVDGFSMNVDPLYKVTSGYIWYLQVLYVIGPATRGRHTRSEPSNLRLHSQGSYQFAVHHQTPLKRNKRDKPHNERQAQNGTNIKLVRLQALGSSSTSTTSLSSSGTSRPTSATVAVTSGLAVVIIVIACVALYIRHRRTQHKNLHAAAGGSVEGASGPPGGVNSGEVSAVVRVSSRSGGVTTEVYNKEVRPLAEAGIEPAPRDSQQTVSRNMFQQHQAPERGTVV